jgi:two-component system, chemotaxis family, protein-glutamate methylesterase/glutaminase
MPINVLVVDDIPMMRSELVKMIRPDPDIGDIQIAGNGEQALEAIAHYKPDVITLDVEMPVMDGLTALKEIATRRKSGEFSSNLKVIILSGTVYENDANARRAKFLGADAVLAKPKGRSFTLDLNPSLLLRTIKNVVA